MIYIHKHYAEYIDELQNISIMKCTYPRIINICFVGCTEEYFIWCETRQMWVQLKFLQTIISKCFVDKE